jgi:hypothetical protein
VADIERIERELREGLEGVTKGPWRAVRDFPDRGDWDGMIVQEMAEQPDGHIRGSRLYDGDCDGFSEADAAHLARCDPDTIRALLDELARRAEIIEWAKEAVARACQLVPPTYFNWHDSARAVLASLEPTHAE